MKDVSKKKKTLRPPCLWTIVQSCQASKIVGLVTQKNYKIHASPMLYNRNKRINKRKVVLFILEIKRMLRDITEDLIKRQKRNEVKCRDLYRLICPSVIWLRETFNKLELWGQTGKSSKCLKPQNLRWKYRPKIDRLI